MYVYYVPLEGGGGGGLLRKVLYKETPLRGPPLTLLYTIFDRKGILSYTFYWQMEACSNTLVFLTVVNAL